jgi:hypothetical protein
MQVSLNGADTGLSTTRDKWLNVFLGMSLHKYFPSKRTTVSVAEFLAEKSYLRSIRGIMERSINVNHLRSCLLTI